MEREKRIEAAIRWTLIGAMVLTIAFIFSNSLRTPAESLEQSDAVGGVIAAIFPPDTALGGFIQEHIRKIGHFAEYGILGVEFALFVIFCLQNKSKAALASIPAAAIIALIDETLQYASGRGPSVADVWIDLGGFTALSFAAYGAVALVLCIRRAAQKNKTETKNG